MEKGKFGEGLGLDFAADGERGDGLEDGEGRAPLAGRGEVIDAYLAAVGEGQALALAAAVIIGDRKRLGFSEKHISVIHLAADPYPTSHRVEIDDGRGFPPPDV